MEEIHNTEKIVRQHIGKMEGQRRDMTCDPVDTFDFRSTRHMWLQPHRCASKELEDAWVKWTFDYTEKAISIYFTPIACDRDTTGQMLRFHVAPIHEDQISKANELETMFKGHMEKANLVAQGGWPRGTYRATLPPKMQETAPPNSQVGFEDPLSED